MGERSVSGYQLTLKINFFLIIAETGYFIYFCSFLFLKKVQYNLSILDLFIRNPQEWLLFLFFCLGFSLLVIKLF